MVQDSFTLCKIPWRLLIKELNTLLHIVDARDKLTNWHPILLLNVSYKIFVNTLQQRLQLLLYEVINNDQYVFLPLRYILDNMFISMQHGTFTIANIWDEGTTKFIPWEISQPQYNLWPLLRQI